MSAGSGNGGYRGDSSPLPPDLDPRGRHRGRMSGGAATTRSWRPVGRALGAILSLGLLLLSAFVWNSYRDINNGVPRENVKVGQKPSSGQDIDGTAQNLLLVGNDDRTNMTNAEVKELKVGRDGGSMATDTMILLHIPADGSKATLISLPRDTFVTIPGYGRNRLNSAYVDGYNGAKGSLDDKRTAGANLLIDTVQNLTGLTVDHYVQVSLLGFYEISNAIGGVPVNLCHRVNDTVAYNRSIGSDGGSGLKLSKGKHVLQGVQALEFVRQRHNLPRGDLDRVRRQQYFLTAAFRKIASVGVLTKLNALGDAAKRSLILDPSLNLISLAKQMQNLSANNIIGKTIPTHDGYVEGQDVLLTNPSRVQKFVDGVINGPAPSSSSSSAAPSSAHSAKPAPSSASSSQHPLDAHCIN